MLKKCKEQSIMFQTVKIQSKISKMPQTWRKINKNFVKLSTNRQKYQKIVKNVEKL